MKTFREFFAEKHGEMKYVWGHEDETALTVQLRLFDTMADYMDYIARESRADVSRLEMSAALSRGGGHGY